MADYSKTARTLVYLLSCAVNEKECEIKSDEIDFDGLYSLAKKHGLCSVTAFALESAGISERRFSQAKLKAKRKLGLFDIEREKIYHRLNEAGIWFLPLKGIVIKDFYPRYGMREMTDNDILCDSTRMADIRDIMVSLGYSCANYGEWHHDTYQKPPTMEFEMHHSLFSAEDTPDLNRYYTNVFDRLVEKGGCEYAFSDKDFYIYMLAHTYKHFYFHGTGLRPLLDIYVFLKTHPDLDFDDIGQEMEKLRMSTFEQRCRDLAAKLFGFQKLGEEDAEFLSLFSETPLYGTQKLSDYNYLTHQLDGRDTKGAKAKYFFDRVFLRGDALEKRYPFFAKHKWLLPALYVYRPVWGIVTRPKNIAHETENVVKYHSPKKRW